MLIPKLVKLTELKSNVMVTTGRWGGGSRGEITISYS